jgi:hypothetical protein
VPGILPLGGGLRAWYRGGYAVGGEKASAVDAQDEPHVALEPLRCEPRRRHVACEQQNTRTHSQPTTSRGRPQEWRGGENERERKGKKRGGGWYAGGGRCRGGGPRGGAWGA